MERMPGGSTGLVDIVREFLEAHQLMRRLFARYRSGELHFAELEALVGDDEASLLYRLKERCHALFRPTEGSARPTVRREELFDLAVGSLFHEAMKFRENFYQREVYGPRVRSLRSQAGEDVDPLFQDFEKILAAVTLRLQECLQESEALLEHTQEQLRVLLVEHRGSGYVTRYLLENQALVEDVFGEKIDALLARIHGDAAAGYGCAARSYLVSGHYSDAERAFASAIARGGDREAMERLSAYARGMADYLAGDYGRSIDWLGRWVDAAGEPDAKLADFAHAAVSRVGQLTLGEDKERVTKAASALLERLEAMRSTPATDQSPGSARR